MIRIAKSPNVPQSLIRTKAYDGEDVHQQLECDQHKKCYLCEKRLTTDFEVEHFKSQDNNSDLRQNWDNLFWSCTYCNPKKGNRFDDILNPTKVNIEDEIRQTIIFGEKKACFEPVKETEEHRNTCKLLLNIHNGTGRLRKIKEENFFEYMVEKMNNFYGLIDQYLNNPTDYNYNLVKEKLQIDKEFLGFKYWIIKSKPQLLEVFANDIIWNKK